MCPTRIATAKPRSYSVQHEVSDVALSRPAIAEEDLPNVLEVWRPPRGEGTRVRVLGAGVRVVRHLRPLHIRARPDLLVQKVEVPHVRVSIRPCGHELAHVRHRPAHAAPHAAVEWPVVVGVVAQRVDAQARRDPFLYRKPLARVEPAVRVAHDEPIDARVRRDEEAPKHAADPARHRLIIHPNQLHAEPLELSDDRRRHRAVEVHAHLPPRVDERRQLRVAQHAVGVPRVGAVQAVRDDAHLVARAERADAAQLLCDRPAGGQLRGGHLSVRGAQLREVVVLEGEAGGRQLAGRPARLVAMPSQHEADAVVDVACGAHVVQVQHVALAGLELEALRFSDARLVDTHHPR
mmetsp:Transcript_39751/g.96516  ORF Transcript_39751/g.96516 Transcript_39751/m.96516 type:complete len:350 (-) Transcript_39751:312-1361(-)